MKRDELVKALTEVGFSDEEIQESIQKAEASGKLEADEPEKDEEGDDNEPEVDKDEMKKAYDEVMSAKSSFDKAMESFMDRFGNVASFEKPKEFVDLILLLRFVIKIHLLLLLPQIVFLLQTLVLSLQ